MCSKPFLLWLLHFYIVFDINFYQANAAREWWTVILHEVGEFIGFPPCLGIEVQSVGVKPNKHGAVCAKLEMYLLKPPLFFPTVEAHVHS